MVPLINPLPFSAIAPLKVQPLSGVNVPVLPENVKLAAVIDAVVLVTNEAPAASVMALVPVISPVPLIVSLLPAPTEMELTILKAEILVTLRVTFTPGPMANE